MSPATCVELFAGAGGAALGLRDAGFQSVLAVEWDADACATLRASGFERVFEGDVREAPLGGLGPVKLLWASPPCQAWSTAGKRLGASDDRNGWPWTIKTIDRLASEGSRPEWVLCENVLGMLQHVQGCDGTGAPGDCAGCYWERFVLQEFRSRYAAVDWRILNATDYGVPQMRRRVFLAAGPTPFPWPEPTHSRDNLLWDKWVGGGYWARHGVPRPVSGPATVETADVTLRVGLSSSMPDDGKAPYVTIRDALGLVYPVRHQSPTALVVQHLPDEVAPTVSGKGTIYAERDTQGDRRFNPHYHGWVRQDSTGNPARTVDEPAAAVTTSGMLYLYDDDPGTRPQKHPDPAKRRNKGAGGRADKVARSLLSALDATGGVLDLFGEDEDDAASPGMDPVVEAKGRRRLTDAECAILQGFPPTWICVGASTSRYRQVGNAVPPPVAQALGGAILSR